MKIFSFFLILCFTFFLAHKKASMYNTQNEKIITSENINKKQSVVFISGFDEDDNSYYKNARTYFSTKKIKIVDGLFSIEEIIIWLNEHYKDVEYDEVHIVCHSNAWRGMSLQTHKNGERITLASLTEMVSEKSFPKSQKGIDENTKIIFHSCGLGKNKVLMQELKNVFSNKVSPKIYASYYFNVFGGKYASHYLAKPYYVFYPTAHSQGPASLSQEIKSMYPAKNIDWFTALKTREETTLGETYSYRFNIPVNWKITFENKEDIPEFEDANAIMDWISERDEMASTLYDVGIPLEKFRWKTTVSENTLTVKGKTTVLCVLQPIINPDDTSEYQNPDFDNKKLYAQL